MKLRIRSVLLTLASVCTLSSLFLVYTVVVTVHNKKHVSLVQKLNSMADSDPSENLRGLQRRFLSHKGMSNAQVATPLATLSTANLPSTAFMALRPYGNRSKFYLPHEASWGHWLLRERTYPTTPRVDRCNNCFRYNYPTLLYPRNICENKDVVDLLIIVTTVPWKPWERKGIRDTWGKFSQTIKGWTVAGPLFLFGTGRSKEDQATIVEEHAKYGDVLQDDYIDSYFNLSIKVLSGYNWFTNNCSQARYILRTADDNYVNVPNMLSYIRTHEPAARNNMVGTCYPYAIVQRIPRSKWYVTYNEYPSDRFPTYCVGTAVLTPASLTLQLLNTSANVPYFILEDIYFGLVLKEMRDGRHLGGSVLNNRGFGIPSPVVSPVRSVCTVSNVFWYSIHGTKDMQMRLIFKYCQEDKDWFHDMRQSYRSRPLNSTGQHDPFLKSTRYRAMNKRQGHATGALLNLDNATRPFLNSSGSRTTNKGQGHAAGAHLNIDSATRPFLNPAQGQDNK